MTTIKEAVQSAEAFLQKVYDGEAKLVRLEEVEETDSPRGWRITLSFTLPSVDQVGTRSMLEQFAASNVLAAAFPRHMKVFVVDQFGSTKAMKNR